MKRFVPFLITLFLSVSSTTALFANTTGSNNNTTATSAINQTLPERQNYEYAYPKYEMRAAWIATVSNTNMPSGMNAKEFDQWAEEQLQGIKDLGFNAVIFQVKPTADALYASKLAPWSTYITGKKQGTDPGYDPLAVMVKKAHDKGLEFHAWINPYRVTMSSKTLADLSADNVASKHPDWVVKYGKQYYLNPGILEVQDYLVDCVAEIVDNYDVDAIHMDDYFYPYEIALETYPDAKEYKKYGSGFKTIGDWRRNNVNTLVAKIYDTIKQHKYWIQFGISPFGVWRNVANDPTGSNTTASTQNYDSLYADTRAWIKAGTIDYIAPQVYWSREYKAANYTTLIDWWGKEIETYAKTHPVNLYIGIADYKIGTDNVWSNPQELPAQVAANRKNPAIKGQMHYSIKQVLENKYKYTDILKTEGYSNIALTPPSPWKNNTIPNEPDTFAVVPQKTGNLIKITSTDSFSQKFVLYRFEIGQEINYDKTEHIIAVIYKEDATEYLDSSATPNKKYTYCIKSLSFTNIESVSGKVLVME